MQAVREEFSTRASNDRATKKVEKTFAKPLDKNESVWYNVTHIRPSWEAEKTLKKVLENPLTKRGKCGILFRLCTARREVRLTDH